MRRITKWFLSLKISYQLYFAFLLVGFTGGLATFIAAQVGPLPSALLLLYAAALTIFGGYITTRLFVALIYRIIAGADQLAQGNTDIEVYAGNSYEAGLLNASFATMVKSIKDMVRDAEMLTDAMSAGKLDVRANTSQHNGDYRVLIEGLNGCLDAVIGPLNVAAEYVERISKGDIPDKISDTYYGDFNEIKNNLNHCIDGLGGLVECTQVLDKMAVCDLSQKVRGEYEGIFAETAERVNTIRNIMILAVKINTHIGQGEFAEDLAAFRQIGKCSDEDRLLPSYIVCMENIQRLVNDAQMLAKAAVAGKLDVRADVSQHQGEYRKVMEGINDTLDAIIAPLNVAAEYIERIANGNMPPLITDDYNGDFNEIKNNLNICIEALSMLVEEVNVAITAGLEGKLDQRAPWMRLLPR